MSPSIPPRLLFAQNVTVRPRSAAASTVAMLPLMTTCGSGGASLSEVDAQQVSHPADAQRGKGGKGNSRLPLNPEPRQRFQNVLVRNAHLNANL